MWVVIGQLIPVALAMAVSSVPVLVTITILLTARRLALPFSAAFVAGMALVLALFAAGSTLIPSPDYTAFHITATLEIIIGLVLILLGLLTLRQSFHARRDTHPAKPMRIGLDRLTPWSAIGLALILNFRPKSLIMAAAGGLVMSNSSIGLTAALWSGLMFVVIGSAPVIALVLYAALVPDKANAALQAIRDWFGRNGKILSSSMLLAVGVFVAITGLFSL